MVINAMPHVVITGAFGFLGRHVAAEMEARGWIVTCIGRPFRDGALGWLHGPGQWQIAELPSPALDELLAETQPDAVVHAAGPASVPRSLEDPASDFRSSAAVFCEVLESVRLYSPSTKVLLLSSAAVYGNPGRLPVSETAVLKPISPYGYHKMMCEKLAEEFHVVYGTATCAARIFSAYAAGLKRQVWWDICRKALERPVVRLSGTGRESRDFVHAADVARGVCTILERGRFCSEAYNLATGTETRITDLARMLVAALGLKRKITFDQAARKGDPLRWRADIRKITALGYAPTVDIAAGLEEFTRRIHEEPRFTNREGCYAL